MNFSELAPGAIKAYHLHGHRTDVWYITPRSHADCAARRDESLPLYGDGHQVRDWIYVLDHCAAIDLVLRQGRDGEV